MSARRVAATVIGAEVVMAASFAIAGLSGHIGAGVAYADAPAGTVTLSELNDRFDSLPVCSEEDCSDQPLQVGWWLDRDTGNWFVSLGDHSVLVIDDTAVAR